MSWYRYNDVAGLNRFMESQAPPDNLIPNDNAYKTRQTSAQIKRPHIIIKNGWQHKHGQYSSGVGECS